MRTEGNTRAAVGVLLPVLRAASLRAKASGNTRAGPTSMDPSLAPPKSAPSAGLELPAEPPVVRTAVPSHGTPDGLMTPPRANALWVARCGKSARRVLTGGDEHKRSCRLGEVAGAKAPLAARLRKGYRFKARLYHPQSRPRAYWS
jgi:hypothetical protein